MAVTSKLTESYNNLEANARALYRALGLLPVETITHDLAAAAVATAWAEADWLLEVLADEHLLEPVAHTASPACYRMDAPVGEHAQALALQHDPAAERTAVLQRLCEWMLATATEAQQRLTKAQASLRTADRALPGAPAAFSDDSEAMGWLEFHENNLLGVLRAAESAGWDAMTWQLVDAFWPLFLRRQPYALWVQAHEIGVGAALRARNPAAVRQMLASGAIGLSAAGRLDEAIEWYTRALDAARESADVRDEGQALLGLGACHHEAGRPAEAREYLVQAMARWESCGYRRGVALATITLGETVLADEGPRLALGYFVSAREVLVDLDDPYEAARALALHGHARVLLGEATEGIAELEAAHEVLDAAGSTRWRARVLEMLGAAHRDQGDLDAARTSYQQATELYAPIRPADADRLRLAVGQL
ncbi:tetratricopeptide repeat protein [Streptomyces sp. SID1121]|uniref:tetratricopeptide repeat protein n=1 Tax=Streptomyces sp. SID1121 TaxID=3425888 RepID=UPI004057A418